MAKIFLSHSSKDKRFVKKLAIDLLKYGHDVWLDEWEIRVGDCIVSGIEGGIADSDFAVVILTNNSVQSGWVDREWKAKYWTEVNRGEVLVLPVLLEDCEVPTLLQTKKYADFRSDYNQGLHNLLRAINPTDSGRLALQERVKYVQERVLDLISRRVEAESKEFYGKLHTLTYENHPQRFPEFAQFVSDSQNMYMQEVGDEVDGIVAAAEEFGVRSEPLVNHVKFSIHTMGWGKVATELGELARRLEFPPSNDS